MRIFSNQNEFHNMVFCLLLPFLAFSKRISIIGSGNWASTVSKLISTNIETKEELKEYNKEVRMWTIHEEFQGRNLTELINESHENSKYLKGYHLSSNIICTENIEYACQDADVICFVVPHQYAQNVLTNMKPYVKPTAVCVSLTKGMFFDTVGPRLLSDTIRQTLPISKVAVLMGANVAKDVAAENFVESTLACTDLNVAQELAKLFSSPHFRIELSTDVAGTELCGALKNVVALGVGFCDGLDYGVSSKAALITQGLKEIIAFNRLFAPDFQLETILNSCGIADIVATSFGGRNRLCAAEFSKRVALGQPADWNEIESEFLKGQRLQGLSTCMEVYQCLEAHMSESEIEKSFPLLRRVYRISFAGDHPSTIFDW